MSKPVQVCTACQFVTLIIYGQNYSQVGNKKPVHLHPNWAEVPNSTSAQFEQKLIRTCTQVGHKSYCAKKTGKQGKVIALCSFLHFLLRLNLQNSLSGKSPWYPLNINFIDGYLFRTALADLMTGKHSFTLLSIVRQQKISSMI